MTTTTLLEPILRAARQAAQLCVLVQQAHLSRYEKVGHEPVTIADYGSQAIIARAISQYFPEDGIMAEESGAQFIELLDDTQRALIVELIGRIIGQTVTVDQVRGWLDHNAGLETPRIWVIDPIDGTKGFLAGRHYVNAVGIMDNRQPVGGILAAPAYPRSRFPNGALLHAFRDSAFIEPLDNPNARVRMFVSQQADFSLFRALESVEKGHSGLARLARVRAIAGISDSLVEQADSMEKYGRVAAGDAELYMRLPRMGSTRPHNIWDHAPGVAILQAAGGTATDVDGTPLDFSTGKVLNNYGIIASNGTRHADIIDAVQALLREEKEATSE
jgi:3'(2'), 5'-bisphosphate nucleotidase